MVTAKTSSAPPGSSSGATPGLTEPVPVSVEIGYVFQARPPAPSATSSRTLDKLDSPKTAGLPELVVVVVSGPRAWRMPVPADRMAVDQALGGESVALAWTTG